MGSDPPADAANASGADTGSSPGGSRGNNIFFGLEKRIGWAGLGVITLTALVVVLAAGELAKVALVGVIAGKGETTLAAFRVCGTLEGVFNIMFSFFLMGNATRAGYLEASGDAPAVGVFMRASLLATMLMGVPAAVAFLPLVEPMLGIYGKDILEEGRAYMYLSVATVARIPLRWGVAGLGIGLGLFESHIIAATGASLMSFGIGLPLMLATDVGLVGVCMGDVAGSAFMICVFLVWLLAPERRRRYQLSLCSGGLLPWSVLREYFSGFGLGHLRNLQNAVRELVTDLLLLQVGTSELAFVAILDASGSMSWVLSSILGATQSWLGSRALGAEKPDIFGHSLFALQRVALVSGLVIGFFVAPGSVHASIDAVRECATVRVAAGVCATVETCPEEPGGCKNDPELAQRYEDLYARVSWLFLISNLVRSHLAAYENALVAMQRFRLLLLNNTVAFLFWVAMVAWGGAERDFELLFLAKQIYYIVRLLGIALIVHVHHGCECCPRFPAPEDLGWGLGDGRGKGCGSCLGGVVFDPFWLGGIPARFICNCPRWRRTLLMLLETLVEPTAAGGAKVHETDPSCSNRGEVPETEVQSNPSHSNHSETSRTEAAAAQQARTPATLVHAA